MDNAPNRLPFHGHVDGHDEYEIQITNISNVTLYVLLAILVHQP